MITNMRFVSAILLALLLSACDIGQFTQTQEFDDYVISLTNDPQPMLAGQPVKLYATMRKDRAAATGCQLVFTKAPHGAKETEREAEVAMPEASRSGIYSAQSVIFSHAGDWDLFVKVNCFGRKREIVFPMAVANG